MIRLVEEFMTPVLCLVVTNLGSSVISVDSNDLTNLLTGSIAIIAGLWAGFNFIMKKFKRDIEIEVEVKHMKESFNELKEKLDDANKTSSGK